MSLTAAKGNVITYFCWGTHDDRSFLMITNQLCFMWLSIMFFWYPRSQLHVLWSWKYDVNNVNYVNNVININNVNNVNSVNNVNNVNNVINVNNVNNVINVNNVNNVNNINNANNINNVIVTIFTIDRVAFSIPALVWVENFTGFLLYEFFKDTNWELNQVTMAGFMKQK